MSLREPSVDEILAEMPAAMKRLHVMTFCTGKKRLTVCAESDDDPCPRCKNIRLFAAAARALRALTVRCERAEAALHEQSASNHVEIAVAKYGLVLSQSAHRMKLDGS